MARLDQELKGSDPQLNDRVYVYEDNSKVVEMSVVGRSWHFSTLHKEAELIIELNLTPYWSQRGIKEFDKHLTGRSWE